MSFIAIAVATPAAAEWMLAELERFSDRRWALPPNRYLLDARGMESVLGPPPAIARAVIAHLRHSGIEARAGIGPTRTAALLMTHAATTKKISALPLAALAALTGCGDAAGPVDIPVSLDVFRRWGLRHLGEVAALPPAALAERLGRAGVLLQRWSRGDDASLRLPGMEPDAPDPKREGRAGAPGVPGSAERQAGRVAQPRGAPRQSMLTRVQAFEPALDTSAALLAWLERELAAITADLDRADAAVEAIALELDLDDGGGPGKIWRWEHRLLVPHRDLRRLLRQFEVATRHGDSGAPPPASLRSAPPSAASGYIRAARLRLDLGRPRRLQAGLFGNPEAERERDERLLTRLRAILGDLAGARVGSAQLLDLHRPGAFRLTAFEPPPRPAQTPKSPPTVLCLRALRPPPPITLAFPPLPAVPGGFLSPIGARFRPPGGPQVEVTRAAGPWRTSGLWWDTDPWNRDEWDIETTAGALYRLAHDRRTRQWLLLGTYD